MLRAPLYLFWFSRERSRRSLLLKSSILATNKSLRIVNITKWPLRDRSVQCSTGNTGSLSQQLSQARFVLVSKSAKLASHALGVTSSFTEMRLHNVRGLNNLFSSVLAVTSIASDSVGRDDDHYSMIDR